MKFKWKKFKILDVLKIYFISDKVDEENKGRKNDRMWGIHFMEIAMFSMVFCYLVTCLMSTSTQFAINIRPENDFIYNAMYEDEEPSKPAKVNINTATKSELTEIKGISAKMSDRILLYRYENGNFNNIYELLNIEGFTKSKLLRIKDSITV